MDYVSTKVFLRRLELVVASFVASPRASIAMVATEFPAAGLVKAKPRPRRKSTNYMTLYDRFTSTTPRRIYKVLSSYKYLYCLLNPQKKIYFIDIWDRAGERELRPVSKSSRKRYPDRAIGLIHWLDLDAVKRLVPFFIYLFIFYHSSQQLFKIKHIRKCRICCMYLHIFFFYYFLFIKLSKKLFTLNLKQT